LKKGLDELHVGGLTPLRGGEPKKTNKRLIRFLLLDLLSDMGRTEKEQQTMPFRNRKDGAAGVFWLGWIPTEGEGGEKGRVRLHEQGRMGEKRK